MLRPSVRKIILFCISLVLYSLVFIREAPAPPPPPPPPSVPAAGDVVYAVTFGAMAGYGAIRFWKSKRKK